MHSIFALLEIKYLVWKVASRAKYVADNMSVRCSKNVIKSELITKSRMQ